MAKKYLVRHALNDAGLELRVDEGGVIRVRKEPGGNWQTALLERAGDSGLHMLLLDNRPIELYLERRRGGARVTIGRHTFDCDVAPWREGAVRARAGAQASGPVRLVAPMTGSVVEVRCSPGQEVAEGDVLLVIESMKMNNEFRATVPGVVETVSVAGGDRVSAGQLLVSLRTHAT